MTSIKVGFSLNYKMDAVKKNCIVAKLMKLTV